MIGERSETSWPGSCFADSAFNIASEISRSSGLCEFRRNAVARSPAEQHVALDLIPTRRKIGNQIFILAGMLAHNLGRELQMVTRPTDRGDLAKRPAKWEFKSLGTIRQHLLHNAGTLARPQGELTLTMNASDAVRDELTRYLDGLMKNAA